MSDAVNKLTEFFEQLGPAEPQGRSRTVSVKAMARGLRTARRQLLDDGPKLGPLEESEERPRTRAECPPSPCPWVGCKWNLYLDVTEAGSLQLNFPELEVDQVPHNCALELAERGGMTLEQVGQVMNVVRERARQIEAQALERLRRAGLDLMEEPGEHVYPAGPLHGSRNR